MLQPKVPPAKERIASSFKQLSTVSHDLNSAATELGGAIYNLDIALSALGLGVSGWHQVAGSDDETDGSFWGRDIGYTQVGGKWGIAIRRRWGNNYRDDYSEETWLFSDAPRWMCIECVGKLPDLFEDLIKRTVETTAKLKAKASEVRELQAAVAAASSELASELK